MVWAGLVTTHRNPEGIKMKERRVAMPSLKPYSQDMLGPGLAQSSGVTAQDSSLAEALGSSIKEVCLRVGWNVGRRCKSNYTVLQVPATTRCAQRPSSERSPAWQQFTCTYRAQKSWQEECLTTLIHQQPITCHACTLPGLHSNLSFSKTLEASVSRAQT